LFNNRCFYTPYAQVTGGGYEGGGFQVGRQGPVDGGHWMVDGGWWMTVTGQWKRDGACMALVFALARAYEFFENCALSSGLSPVYSCFLRPRGRMAWQRGLRIDLEC